MPSLRYISEIVQDSTTHYFNGTSEIRFFSLSPGVICLVSFLFAATTVLSSGEYWLQFIDSHCSGIPLLVIGLVEVLAISYIYGLER